MLAPQAARQPAYTPEWHTCTHCYSSPPAQAICSQKAKRERFSTHTTDWHLISQPKGWLAQRWLRLCLCPTQKTTLSSCRPWASSCSVLLFHPSTFLLPTALYLHFFFLPSSVSYPPSCPPPAPPLIFCLFFSISSPFCTAPLCTAPVLPHSQGGITTQNAGSGGKEGGKRSEVKRGAKTGRLPLCLQAISYSLGCRWNLILTAFTCQVWLLASLIK